MKDKEKFSTMMVNGEIVNLTSLSDEKLSEIKQQLGNQQEEIRKEIDQILN